MQVETKEAEIVPTGEADDFPGTFDVVLSAPTKDRDGDTLLPGDWKTPLPEHITFDQDHGMSVASTVGSGRPELAEDGRLVVHGTYSSLPRAQEVRTLVKEGHIRSTSVAFMSEQSTEKDGSSRKIRELLNGAFVAVPSNREAVVLAVKHLAEATAKAGARTNKDDAATIQKAHDLAVEIHELTMQLGALHAAPDKADDSEATKDVSHDEKVETRSAAEVTTDAATAAAAVTKDADMRARLELRRTALLAITHTTKG